MILTQLVVGATKCKFIVSLYLLGAAYGGRDYFRSQDTIFTAYIQYIQHYNIVELEAKSSSHTVDTKCTISAKKSLHRLERRHGTEHATKAQPSLHSLSGSLL